MVKPLDPALVRALCFLTYTGALAENILKIQQKPLGQDAHVLNRKDLYRDYNRVFNELEVYPLMLDLFLLKIDKQMATAFLLANKFVHENKERIPYPPNLIEQYIPVLNRFMRELETNFGKERTCYQDQEDSLF